MKHSRKSTFALVVLLAVVAAACGGGGGNESNTTPSPQGSLSGTTITFSDSLAESEVPAVQDLLSQFHDQTGATVKLTAVDAQTLPQKLKVEKDSGHHTIQVFAQDNLALATLVDQGLVQDLSDVQLPSQITPSLIPQKFDGKQYFLPYRPNVKVTYVNKDRFSSAGVSPPETVDQYKSVAEKLKAAGGSGKITLQLATQPDTGPLGVTVSEWVVSYGGDPLILNDSGSVQAFTFLQGMWKEGDFAQESKLAKYDTDVDYLKGETAWMATNWPFTTAELADADLLDKFQVYEGWKGPSRAAHVIGGEVLGIPEGVTGKEKEAALALAQFLISKDAQEELVAKNSWPSVRSDALGQVPAEQKSTFDAIQAALADGWYRPNVVYWPDVEAAMADAVSRIIYNGESAATVLNDEHSKIAAAAKSDGVQYPPSG
jgi:trehalose transport system substrate-binding protein